ncbi:NtaA/DmoA family FMN-dependent monooxygenase [Neotabrizicola sp. VNH66]|uniref:NtaA/DmoA family FMN-dependent monooxygenase n=1 Tax=Neotabrizicola sp. VNH66 TaxID=3400918 RepID=UPI003C04720C
MKLRPKLCIGMSLAPTWLANEGWRAEGSGIEGLYGLELAADVACRAEAAHLDFVFRPDASFLPLPVMEQSFGFSSLDPMLLITALMHRTRKIGLLTTISTTFGEPYLVARQLMSLHWLSQGRAGWNVVTALQGHENFSMTDMPGAEARYARANEFADVVRALWASFPAEALVVDRASGRYADTDLILPIDHRGAYFAVKGPMNLPEYPGPRLPLMQAGGSAAGVDFAGRIADMVFGLTQDIDSARSMRAQLSARALAHRRQPRDLRLLPGLSLYLGDTREEAQALFQANHVRVTRDQRLARVTEALGVDLKGWPDDRRLTAADLPAGFVSARSPAHCDTIRRIVEREAPQLGELLARPEILASIHWQIVGTVEDAAEEITRWFEAGAIDGFIAVPGGSVRSLELTLGELVPRLAEAGLFRKDYSGDTFLHHLTED